MHAASTSRDVARNLNWYLIGRAIQTDFHPTQESSRNANCGGRKGKIEAHSIVVAPIWWLMGFSSLLMRFSKKRILESAVFRPYCLTA